MSELTSRIDEAFTRPAFQDAIRLVKDAVQQELQGMDDGLGIEQTRFFNHAIYPDLVLRWHERGVSRERPLFLRFEVAEWTVQHDLIRHGPEAPMFIGLLDHRDDPQVPDEPEVVEDATERLAPFDGAAFPLGGALLAEAAAIDLLEDFARSRPSQVVATSAIARGGHGHISGERARSLSESLEAGFEAASEGRDAGLVLDAFDQLEELISSGQADQLATHLQLLWLGSGGELADLFGEGRLQVDALNDLQLRELLEYLLSRDEPPTTTTLRRFASAIDPDRLGKLIRNFEGGHLGALVEANLAQWTTRWVQVLEGRGSRGWRICDELLRLDLGTVELTFTSRGKKLSRFRDGEPIARIDFTSRLGDDETISLDMVSDEAELALRRRRGADAEMRLRPGQIEALGELARLVIRGSVVSSAVQRPGASQDGLTVGIDYARGLCSFDADVPLGRARRFAERYYGIATEQLG